MEAVAYLGLLVVVDTVKQEPDETQAAAPALALPVGCGSQVADGGAARPAVKRERRTPQAGGGKRRFNSKLLEPLSTDPEENEEDKAPAAKEEDSWSGTSQGFSAASFTQCF